MALNNGDGRNEDGRAELEVHGPGGTKLRARGYDSIMVLLVVALAVNSAVLYRHTTQTEDASRDLTELNRTQARLIRELTFAQRFTACILATDPEKREREYMSPNSFCNSLKLPPGGSRDEQPR